MSAATPPESPPKEKGAPGERRAPQWRVTPQLLDVRQQQVKLEARQHLARWLETGQKYHLLLARVKFAALRKGAA